MLEDRISEALTFDDVLLVPQRSDVLPSEVDVSTRLTKTITLSIPIVSAAMDTVTEAPLAIAMAQEGGLGIVHKNMTITAQAAEVDKVKRSESGMIVDPVTVSPTAKVAEALEVMARYRISGVPVTKGTKLVGILTNRDLRFETRTTLPVSDLMTKDDLITVPVGTTLEQAKEILHRHKIEKLLVVDRDYNLKGLITVKDIQKQIKYPNACKDSLGRLRVGAALGVTPDVLDRAAALIEAKVDVVVIDTAHGHTSRVLETIEAFRKRFPDQELIAGNVGTFEGAADLIAAGVSAVKVGMGPGSICTTRIVSGAGMPQITAISQAAQGGGQGRRADHRRRRRQVLRRRGQGAGRGRVLGDDRVAVRGDGRKPRRADPPPGAVVQELPRDGLHRGDEGRLARPLLPGVRGELAEAGAGRHRGHGPLQGPAVGHGAAARGRPARGDGLLRHAVHQGAGGAGAVRAHLQRGPQGEPRPRRDHHQGSAQLPSRVGRGRAVLAARSLLVAAAGCRRGAGAEQVLTYFNPEHALSLRYPASWKSEQVKQGEAWYRYFTAPPAGAGAQARGLRAAHREPRAPSTLDAQRASRTSPA